MELAEMICLPALCTSPLKGRVIGFFWAGARGGRACTSRERASHPSGVAGGVRDGSLRRGAGYVSGVCES